jgi:hypothetical protein
VQQRNKFRSQVRAILSQNRCQLGSDCGATGTVCSSPDASFALLRPNVRRGMNDLGCRQMSE